LVHEILNDWCFNIFLVIPVVAAWELTKWLWRGIGKW